jgi:peptidoglycan/LPS O-acetylase OafA/YrhL
MMCTGSASPRSGRTESFASICVLAAVLGGVQDTWLFEALFYLNLLFQCLAVLALALMTHSPYRKFVKVFGDLSYPVFLGHWLVGYVIAALFFQTCRSALV